LNVGETHYPYAKPDEDSSMWPRISGVNGVFRKMNDQIAEAAKEGEDNKFGEEFQFFDQDKLDQLRERQIDTVRYLDGVFEQLYDMVPENTHIVVTADSVNMISEAAGSGKPVYILALEGGSKKFTRFHRTMIERGIARPFDGKLAEWRYTPLNETARVATLIRERLVKRGFPLPSK
jgi:hypothetical protein